MTSELPTKDQLYQQDVDGRPITQTEASAVGSDAGGSAVTAQSSYDKQQNLVDRAGEVASKYPAEITKDDAAEVQKAEAQLLGERPGKDSTWAKVQSIADQNAASIEQKK
ncbi:hypothetical protein BKA67DRAFT_655492 [Truncatella angustata]|uniref:SMP domain-containing protein n=1 Tax=Truncatella angustata TaxID=152316 RepID=A0A9P8USG7_9PEZI|nr:uncharacterized protein BKA67DRAFT_655492 [Truncatella angustata]KAH6657210.1 hypothetical protein BKA67DRAFT_655492 [Truncatella angustata]KAH8196436.1 hypothetical protein TruAng_009396 [Truncatella angustata]